MTVLKQTPKKYYMVVNKNGNPIPVNEKLNQLPIYWRLKDAKRRAEMWKGTVVNVYI